MTFGIPALLWLLILAPLALIAYVLFQRRRPRYVVRFTNLNLLANVAPRRASWRRHLPPVLYLLALAAVIIALARPYATLKLPRQEGTVMLVMDVSGSMDATDVHPTRLLAAVNEAERFVNQLPAQFRVGVVAFSSAAQVLTPPTYDRVKVRQALESLRANGGTAMGEGIERALQVSAVAASGGSSPPSIHDRLETPGTPAGGVGTGASASSGLGPGGASVGNGSGASVGGGAVGSGGPAPAPAGSRAGAPPTVTTSRGSTSTALVLLSDGASNSGQVTPAVAAQEANRLHVPIYTISLGTPGGTLDLRIGGWGYRRIAVPPDPAVLRQVAQISGGRFFAAPSDQDLRSIYENLASHIGFTTRQRDVAPLFLGGAIALLLSGGALATWWFHRFP